MYCFENLSQIVTMENAFEKDGRGLKPEDLSIKKNYSLVFDDQQILWLGNSLKMPKVFQKAIRKDLSGHVLTPEIVDSHTHLVFGGNRSQEYSMRLNGLDYQQIANNGGGILSTMESTITASEDELFHSGVERINRMRSYGVGSIEIKSGYGLTIESERKISHVIHRLKQYFSDKIKIYNTYLAAHAVPGGFQSSTEYIDKVVIPLLNELSAEKIIDFVDIFHEKGYFSQTDTTKLFKACERLKLKTKIHADEFNDNGGAQLAVAFNAASADHLLCTGEDGISALSQSQTVATLLPGTALFLGKPLVNARNFLDKNCKVALASDYNPGSCHCDNLLLIASICARKLEMNLCELWAAITLNAAHAVGASKQGVLKPGFEPRFSLFKCKTVDEITYSWGRNLATTESL